MSYEQEIVFYDMATFSEFKYEIEGFHNPSIVNFTLPRLYDSTESGTVRIWTHYTNAKEIMKWRSEKSERIIRITRGKPRRTNMIMEFKASLGTVHFGLTDSVHSETPIPSHDTNVLISCTLFHGPITVSFPE
jgi:hypothetical protein